MPSLPKDAIPGVVAGGLLTLCGNYRRRHGPLPCFDHLPQIVDSLEQHPLGILMPGEKLIDVCACAGQGLFQGLILGLQHFLASQAGIKGIFKRCDPLRERFGPAADQCGRRLALCFSQFLYDRAGRSSTCVLEYVAVSQWLSKSNTLLNHLLNSLPIGVPRTLGCSRFAHSSNIVANATVTCRKTSDQLWNRGFPWNIGGVESSENPCALWLSLHIEERLTKSRETSMHDFRGRLNTRREEHSNGNYRSRYRREAQGLLSAVRSIPVQHGHAPRLIPSPNRSIPTRKPRFTAVFHYCGFSEVDHTLANLETPGPEGAEYFVQKEMAECGDMATVGRVKTRKAAFCLPARLTNRIRAKIMREGNHKE